MTDPANPAEPVVDSPAASIAYDTQFGALLAIYAHATLSGENEEEFKRLVAYVDALRDAGKAMLDEVWNTEHIATVAASKMRNALATTSHIAEPEICADGVHVNAIDKNGGGSCIFCDAPVPASEAVSVPMREDTFTVIPQNMVEYQMSVREPDSENDLFRMAFEDACREEKPGGEEETMFAWDFFKCGWLAAIRVLAAPAAPKGKPHAMTVKDHVLREVVNSLRDIAVEFHGSGQLRARLRAALDPLLAAEPVAWMCPDDPDAASAFKWARKGVDYTGLSCDTCGKKHVPVFVAAVPDGYQLMPVVLTDDMLRYAMECTKQLGPDGARRIKSTYYFLCEAARLPVVEP